LYEIIKAATWRSTDANMRISMSRADAIETGRLAHRQEEAVHKIDVIVALARAALGAVTGGQNSPFRDLLDYYRHRADGKVDPNTDPNEEGEMMRTYENTERLAGESGCCECGLRLRPARVLTGNGRGVHPECWTMKSAGRQ
jgi:hypothetical protein